MKYFYTFWKQFFKFTFFAVEEGVDAEGVDDDSGADEQEEAPLTTEDLVREELGLEIEEDDEGEPNEEEVETAESGSVEEEKEGEEKSDEEKAAAEQEGEPKDGTDDLYVEPEGLTDKASDRFKSLVESAKEKDVEIDALNGRVEAFNSIVESAKATNEEFTDLINYSAMVKSGDINQVKQALAMLDEQRTAICKTYGLESNGFDPLAEYGDLNEKVELGELDRGNAVELANARNQVKASEQAQTDFRAQQQTVQADEQARQLAVQNITQLQNNWQKTDIDFQAKLPQLMSKVQKIMRDYPVDLWATVLNDQYQTIGSAMLEQAGNTNIASINPARSNTTTTAQKEPENTMDLAKQILNMG